MEAESLLKSIGGMTVSDWLPGLTIVNAFVMVMDPVTRMSTGAFSSSRDEAMGIVRHAYRQFTGNRDPVMPAGPDLAPIASAVMQKFRTEHAATMTANVILVLLWAQTGHWHLSYANLPSANDVVAILEGLVTEHPES